MGFSNVGANITYSYSSSPVFGANNTGNAIASSIGGLVGENQGGLISNSNANGPVVGVSIANGRLHVGGLVGQTNGVSIIIQSYATGSVTATGNAAIGGLVGDNGGALGLNQATILKSFATGNVVGGTSGEVGGLVGLNRGAITQAYATGSVSGTGASTIGGLIGTNSVPVDQSYAIGRVSSGTQVGLTLNGPQVGGLIGRNTESGLIGLVTNSYWDTQRTGQSSSSAGTSKTTAQLTSGLPAGFDSSVWTINLGITYPYFSWQPANTIPKPASSTSSSCTNCSFFQDVFGSYIGPPSNYSAWSWVTLSFFGNQLGLSPSNIEADDQNNPDLPPPGNRQYGPWIKYVPTVH